MRAKRQRSSVLNAFRHQRINHWELAFITELGLGAQRLSASTDKSLRNAMLAAHLL